MSREAREKMDAYTATRRRDPQRDAATTVRSSEEPLSEAEVAEAVTAAVERITLAETGGEPEIRLETQAPPTPPASKAATSDRAELIRRARAIHRAKQSVLEALDAQTRERLTETAMQAFFNERSKTKGE